MSRTRSLVLAAAMAAAPCLTAAAQTGTTDPILRRMWTLGIDS